MFEGGKCTTLFFNIEIIFVSKLWSKTVIHFNAICVWTSLLNYDATIVGQVVQGRLGWAIHHELNTKLGDTHTDVTSFALMWHVCYLWSRPDVLSSCRFIALVYTPESPTDLYSTHISWSRRCHVIHTCCWTMVHLAWHHAFPHWVS